MFNFMQAFSACRKTEMERDCNVYLTGTKETQTVNKLGACVKWGFSGGNHTTSELLRHLKTYCQHIHEEAESKSSPWWEQAALDEAWKGTHKHTQMCSASLTIAYRGLPALNDCGTTRQTSDVFDRYIKHFQCWKMFIGCIARGRLTPCNATFLSIVILRVNVCNFVHSAERPVQDMSFSLCQKKRKAPSSKS